MQDVNQVPLQLLLVREFLRQHLHPFFVWLRYQRHPN